MSKSKWLGVLFGALALFASSTYAADTKKIVIQISDADVAKQNLALNVATNLQKHYGLADSQIEIVAFGPGLKLLIPNAKDKAATKVQGRIDNLAANQIRFSACGNTMKNMAKKSGHEPKLNKNAKVVDAGAARIVDLVGQGYTLLRP